MVVAFVFWRWMPHFFHNINQLFVMMVMVVVLLTFCFRIGNVSITASAIFTIGIPCKYKIQSIRLNLLLKVNSFIFFHGFLKIHDTITWNT